VSGLCLAELSALLNFLNFEALNDNECDEIFELIRKFCSESDAAIYLQKSSFTRVNNCKIRPQQTKETDRLKILRMSVHANIIKRNLIATRFIYEYFNTGVNFTPRIETEFPAVDFSIIWFKLSRNFIPSD
jgi:hypothetical protein